MGIADRSDDEARGGNKWLESAERYRDDLARLLRDLIAIPAESCREEARCRRLKQELESLGFDQVFFDPLGTVVARIGNGPKVLLMDGHIDTVGVGDPESWDHDPFEGKFENGEIWGRGAVDELPGVVCMAYGAKLLMDRGIPEDLTLYLTASVMEEPSEGLGPDSFLAHFEELGWPRPQGVVLGEPTDLAIYRGQRGRLEAVITLHGRAAHGAQPDLGVNALYRAAEVLADLQRLSDRLGSDPFLGPGTLVASDVECATPSRNAVPDLVRIFVDRRLTLGESPEQALEQLRSLPSLAGGAEGVDPGTVEVVGHRAKAWTGQEVRQEKIYPTWVVPESHDLVTGMAGAVEDVLGHEARIGCWSFSTNGVSTMGRHGIPTVGFAPGLEDLAHTTEERVAVDDLVKATAVYARMSERFARHGSWDAS